MKILMAAMFLLMMFSASAQETATYKLSTVYYVSSYQNETTVNFFDQFKRGFANSDIRFNQLDPATDTTPNDDNALYIATGNRSLEYLIENNINSPILAIFISRVSYQRIIEKHGLANKQRGITAIFSDPSPAQQLLLIKHLFPNRPKTALIISDRTAFLSNEFKQIAADIHIPLSITTHAKSQNISKTLKDTQDANVLIAIPDASIYSTESLQRILLSAYRRNQSIIGFSRQLVDAGGLATVYSDKEHIRKQVTRSVNKILLTGNLPEPGYSKDFEVKINERVANSYNLILPRPSELKSRILESLEACCEP